MPTPSEIAEKKIQRATLKARRAHLRYTGTKLRGMLGVLEESAKQLESLLARYAGDDGYIPVARQKALLAEMERLIQTLNQEIERAVGEIARGSVELATDAQGVILAGALPTELAGYEARLFGGVGMVNVHALEAFWDFIEADGLTLSQRLWVLGRKNLGLIERILTTGIAQGRAAVPMARELRKFLTEKGKQNARFNAWRLAVTESNRAYHLGTQTYYESLPWLEMEKYNLSASHPRYDICDEYATGGPNGDGTYPKGEAPQPPVHPMCQCYLTAVIPSADELRAYLGLVGTMPIEQVVAGLMA